jgi:hypothetical protein
MGGATNKKEARKNSTKTDSSGAGSTGMVATPDTSDHVLEVMNKPKKGIMFYEGEFIGEWRTNLP